MKHRAPMPPSSRSLMARLSPVSPCAGQANRKNVPDSWHRPVRAAIEDAERPGHVTIETTGILKLYPSGCLSRERT